MKCIKILFVLLSLACLWDCRRGRIPNGIVLAALTVGTVWRIYGEGIQGLAGYLSCALLWLGILYPLYALGMFGAGDVKLLAAAEGFFPLRDGAVCFLCIMSAGAVMALVKMLYSRSIRERLGYFVSYMKDIARTGRWRLYLEDAGDRRHTHIPMTVPMLAGFMLYIGGWY